MKMRFLTAACALLAITMATPGFAKDKKDKDKDKQRVVHVDSDGARYYVDSDGKRHWIKDDKKDNHDDHNRQSGAVSRAYVEEGRGYSRGDERGRYDRGDDRGFYRNDDRGYARAQTRTIYVIERDRPVERVVSIDPDGRYYRWEDGRRVYVRERYYESYPSREYYPDGRRRRVTITLPF